MRDPVHGADAKRWGGWHWSEPRRGEHFSRCSYCGSVRPEDLVKETTLRASWADMKYGWPHKFYVDIPNQDPDAQFCIGSAPNDGRAGYISCHELTSKQREIITRDGMGVPDVNRSYKFGTRAAHFGKFYTVHLMDPAVTPEVRGMIEKMCGLRFTFEEGGYVRWRRIGYDE